ncbi:MAG: preprotein translocase subunit SecY [Spirochaetia bacterium]|nr:MAG: preprotein translocase subunit SecY [Spirochaetia bacterium]
MNKLIQLFKISDLRKKILIVGLLLAATRVLSAIPIPSIDAMKLKEFLASSQLFGFVNLFSGGGLSHLSIVMIGVAPYITATIIMQLLTMIFPRLKEMYYEEGAAGKAKFNRWSRYITVPLAGLQAYGFLNILVSQGVIPHMGMFDLIKNVIIVSAGTMILVWLGELITEHKIGNGISLIIFAGIISGLPATVGRALFSYSAETLPTYLIFAILAILVVAGVVFINEGERKIPIAYAKRVRGMKMYGGASSYLPLKVNQAGVIPIIFAISILLFPQFIAQAMAIFSRSLSLTLTSWVNYLFNNQYLYSAFYFLLVFIFTYFYTAVTFDPKEISKNLQRSGGFVAGIRPGDSTTDFLSKIINRLTLSGAMFLGLLAILPNLTQMATGIKILTIGGTALLIVVSVALETIRQINSQLIMREYEEI